MTTLAQITFLYLYIQETLSDMKKENISDDFQKIFKGKKVHINKNSAGLEKANEAYNDLVNKGVIKQRGYTLRGIEDIHLFQVKSNGY